MNKTCFVVCPISGDGTETRKRSDDLLEFIIQPVCQELGYEAIRVDKINANDKIDSTIIDYLEKSELVIADVTDHNPNAFFELGYRTALKKPFIQVNLHGEALPFDISTTRTISYTTTNIRKAEETKRLLLDTIRKIESEARVLSSVSVSHSQPPQNDLLRQMLQMLFDLKTSVDGLYPTISKSYNDLIERIMRTSFNEVAKAQPKDFETAMMEAFVPELFKNPEILEKIVDMGKKLKHGN